MFSRISFFFFFAIIFQNSIAQKYTKIEYYGFVRSELFYDTRENETFAGGAFYMYPSDKKFDSSTKDLNKQLTNSFCVFGTRLGVNVCFKKNTNLSVNANVEADFGGGINTPTSFQLRHSFVSFNWDNSKLIIGQTWHPLYGDVFPDILNISTGAPFQPFSRNPQIFYSYKDKSNVNIILSLLWQSQYVSNGPLGKSVEYSKNSFLPEFYLGIQYVKDKKFLVGLGVDAMSISPRNFSEWENDVYKIKENISTLSFEGHFKYVYNLLSLKFKSVLASNLEHVSLLGGYAVTNINESTGKRDYTSFLHSTSWFNLTYGSKVKTSLFLGFSKNLGTNKPLLSDEIFVYGTGLNIDKLITLNLNCTYNSPNYTIGIEYSPATAYYGNLNYETGRVINNYPVTNNRILCSIMYFF